MVVRARGNYASTLDMQSRRIDATAHSGYIIQRYGSAANVFRKITVRCICYPLGKVNNNDHIKYTLARLNK